jgi:hypothetical protein
MDWDSVPHPTVMTVCCIRHIPEGSQLIYNRWETVLSVDAIPET